MNLIFRLIKIVHVITDLFNVSTNTNTHTQTHFDTPTNACIYVYSVHCTANIVRCGCYCCVVGIFAKTNKPYYHDGSMFFLLCYVAFVCVCVFCPLNFEPNYMIHSFLARLFSVLDFIMWKQNTINIFLCTIQFTPWIIPTLLSFIKHDKSYIWNKSEYTFS